MENQPVYLSIIFSPHNGGKVLAACLDSVYRSQTKYKFECIVHDNGSTDDTVQMLRERYPQVKVIEGGNIGFGPGNNRGAEVATGKYLLFLNADTEVREDTFEVMLDFMETHPEIGIANCKIVMPNGQLDTACRRAFPTPWRSFTRISGLYKVFPQSRLFNHYNFADVSPDQETEIDWCSGAFFLISRELFDKVGRWDEDYWVYGEDVDLCLRVHEAGKKIYYYPKTSILHIKGFSRNPRIIWEFHRSMMVFYKKRFANKYPVPLWWLIHLTIWLRYLLVVRFKPYKYANFAGRPQPVE